MDRSGRHLPPLGCPRRFATQGSISSLGFHASGANAGALATPFSAIGLPGAYIVYNPISAPSATSNAASAIGSTTATVNGTVGDGGQNASGDTNHSKYYFQ